MSIIELGSLQALAWCVALQILDTLSARLNVDALVQEPL